jgi:hypothetical protein
MSARSRNMNGLIGHGTESARRSVTPPRPRHWTPLLLALVLPLALAACALPFIGPEGGQQVFDTPQDAGEALFVATEADDLEGVRDILGSKYTDRFTAAWEEHRDGNAKVVEAATQKLVYEDRADGSVELLLGEQQWPFPIPLVRGWGGWYFDTLAGMEEMRDRRIGRDELVAIEIARAYIDAQIEYASVDWNGDGVFQYARKLLSTPGTHDGLYWPVEGDERESPFGQLVSDNEVHVSSLAPGDPVRGYRFQVLTAQGPNPLGGAYDYIVSSRMVAGFAMVAYPDVYGDTGVMTFVTSHHGRVFEKDRGQDAGAIERFDPDDTWSRVEPLSAGG